MAYAADDLDLVLLEGHPRPAAVAEAAASQLATDLGARDLDAGGHAVEHRDQGRAVRLTGGQPTQHVDQSGTLRVRSRQRRAPRLMPWVRAPDGTRAGRYRSAGRYVTDSTPDRSARESTSVNPKPVSVSSNSRSPEPTTTGAIISPSSSSSPLAHQRRDESRTARHDDVLAGLGLERRDTGGEVAADPMAGPQSSESSVLRDHVLRCLVQKRGHRARRAVRRPELGKVAVRPGAEQHRVTAVRVRRP